MCNSRGFASLSGRISLQNNRFGPDMVWVELAKERYILKRIALVRQGAMEVGGNLFFLYTANGERLRVMPTAIF